MTQIPEAYYLVLDYGRIGRESVIDWENADKETIIRRVVNGDYTGNLLAVHCIDMEFGLWSNVSEDIGQEIVDRLVETPHPDLFDWLENQFGCERMNQWREVA